MARLFACWARKETVPFRIKERVLETNKKRDKISSNPPVQTQEMLGAAPAGVRWCGRNQRWTMDTIVNPTLGITTFPKHARSSTTRRNLAFRSKENQKLNRIPKNVAKKVRLKVRKSAKISVDSKHGEGENYRKMMRNGR